MKAFGKKPATILAAGSLVLAMTACRHASSEAQTDSLNTTSTTSQLWTQLFGKISKTLRGGFGNSSPLDNSIPRKEEEDDFYEDSGAGE